MDLLCLFFCWFSALWFFALGSFFDFSLVLRPASSITAFQHHVTRSLRWFNVSSPGSSPCWPDHCVSTPCDLITAVDPVDHCNGSTLVLLVLCPTGLITAFQHHVIRSLRRFHVESRGSSPCWLDHCVSTPCDSNTAAVPRWFSWFFAVTRLKTKKQLLKSVRLPLSFQRCQGGRRPVVASRSLSIGIL